MKSKTKNTKTWIAIVLAAFIASLCCITPVLALISGVTGIAATFSWMEPYRPALISLTVLVLAFAWYQKLKLNKTNEVDCNCAEEKSSFWQGKLFLGMVTLLAVLLMLFPYYSSVFFPKIEQKEEVVIDKSMVRTVKFNIEGMDCEACSNTINMALSKLPGVLKYETAFKTSSTKVQYNSVEAKLDDIVDAINATGYKVSGVTAVEE
jgi:mercuric ion transport protein